jgi:hypothetical protein
MAWQAYNDPDTPKSCLQAIEKEMDSAQNHFEWDEFQEFKVTLEGFEEFWESFRIKGQDAVRKMQSRGECT